MGVSVTFLLFFRSTPGSQTATDLYAKWLTWREFTQAQGCAFCTKSR